MKNKKIPSCTSPLNFECRCRVTIATRKRPGCPNWTIDLFTCPTYTVLHSGKILWEFRLKVNFYILEPDFAQVACPMVIWCD